MNIELLKQFISKLEIQFIHSFVIYLAFNENFNTDSILCLYCKDDTVATKCQQNFKTPLDLILVEIISTY